MRTHVEEPMPGPRLARRRPADRAAALRGEIVDGMTFGLAVGLGHASITITPVLVRFISPPHGLNMTPILLPLATGAAAGALASVLGARSRSWGSALGRTLAVTLPIGVALAAASPGRESLGPAAWWAATLLFALPLGGWSALRAYRRRPLGVL